MRVLLHVDEAAEREALLAQVGRRVALRVVSEVSTDLDDVDVLWLHRGPRASDEGPVSAAVRDAVRAWLHAGGRLLLTGCAARLVGAFADEPVLPALRRGVVPDDVDALDVRGVMAMPGHPLQARASGGVFLRHWRPGEPFAEAVYEAGARPRRGRLEGVEKRHIGCDGARGLLTRHEVGDGVVLALGAHLVFDDAPAGEGVDGGAPPPRFVEQRARFVGDLVDHLMNDVAAAAALAWPDDGGTVRARAAAVPGPAAFAVPPDPHGVPHPLSRHPVDGPDDDAFFDLVDPAGLALYGRARAGWTELWAFPHRVLHAVRVARVDDADGRPDPVALTIAPAAVERRHLVGEQVWLRERLGLAAGALVVEYHNPSAAAIRLRWTARADHRLFWPYPVDLCGLRATSDLGGARLELRDTALGRPVRVCFDGTPERAWLAAIRATDVDPACHVLEIGREFEIPAGETLRLHVAAPATGATAIPVAAPDPTPAAHACEGLEVRLDDEALDRALWWVRQKAEDMRLRDPDGTLALVAGHDATRPGWFASRPGYAWFFGRDSILCARAHLAFGDVEVAAGVLRLLARHQDAEGKVFHERTPAGVVHFDAADATPMFVDGVANHVHWTGDRDLARELWPAVRRALRWLEIADRDGDGLAENAGNGHGWMEGGPLAEGLHVELYQAVWQWRAHRAGAFLADLSGEAATAAAQAGRAAAVARAIDERFWLVDAGRHAHALRADGSPDRNETILTLAPLVEGPGTPGDPEDVLAPLASLARSADWAPRMVGTDHPDFDPGSYQAGSAWPLFAMWAIQADLMHGRPDGAWRRWVVLLRSVLQHAPGVMEEVWRGDTFTARGICPHQAWSHAAVLTPLVAGVLGVRVDPADGGPALEPCLPAALPRLRFAGLAFGGMRLSGALEHRDGGGLRVDLARDDDGEAAAAFDVAPFVATPARLREVRRDGEVVAAEAHPGPRGLRVRTRVELAPGARTRLEFVVEERLRLVDDPAQPEPGATSTLPRVLRRTATDAAVELELELVDGEHRLGVAFPGGAPRHVDGGRLDGGALVVAGPGRRVVTFTFGDA